MRPYFKYRSNLGNLNNDEACQKGQESAEGKM